MMFDLLRSNGVRWAMLALAERLKLTDPQVRHLFELKKGLPGFNTVAYNRMVWSAYDWREGGEEWSDSAEWKEALVNRFIHPYASSHPVVLEIGPGAARWSTILASHASILHLVDITDVTLQVCREKLAQFRHCHFHLLKDELMSFLPDGSIGFVWSFDVFVHIAPEQTSAYLKSLARIMSPGAIAVIHHPSEGNAKGGFRSSVTNEFFLDALKRNGLTVMEQTAVFGDNNLFNVEHFKDLITVFTRPR